MMYAADYRALAHNKLRGHTGTWLAAFIIISLIASAISTIIGLINGTSSTLRMLTEFMESGYFYTEVEDSSAGLFSIIASIINILLVVPICFGLFKMALNNIRSQEVEVGDLFYCFKDYKRVVILQFITSLYTFLWSLLFVIPGIIKAYSYSMSPYILIDNPEMTQNEARQESMRIMSGNKWRLFCLEISYIGWIFLGMFTFGILYIWIIPRMQLAEAEFYNSLVAETPFTNDFYRQNGMNNGVDNSNSFSSSSYYNQHNNSYKNNNYSNYNSQDSYNNSNYGEQDYNRNDRYGNDYSGSNLDNRGNAYDNRYGSQKRYNSNNNSNSYDDSNYNNQNDYYNQNGNNSEDNNSSNSNNPYSDYDNKNNSNNNNNNRNDLF